MPDLADITRFFACRDLRSEMLRHVISFRSGQRVRPSRSLAFWFRPDRTSIARRSVKISCLKVQQDGIATSPG
jgi:hypothetical protein